MSETPADTTTPAQGGGITCAQDGAVLTITMNRPELRNAMRPSTWTALAEIGETIGADVRVVVIRGAGEAFSAGLDRRLFAGESLGGDPSMARLFAATWDDFDRTIE